ncbi:MAG: septum site-determining protein MinD [Clostridia bacterium]|nr:septum site-determining protein MinD [Clostridia bacterium]
MGRVMVITSGKGGVGKSTVTAGLGAALGRRGKKVLLIDGDAGLRNLDILLGVAHELVFDIYDVLVGNCEPIKAIYQCPDEENLYLMPAPQSEENRVTPELMTKLIKGLSDYYDYVLVDCPGGMDSGFKAAIAAAQAALIVITPDAVCIRDADIIRTRLVKEGMKNVRLVINRFSLRALDNNRIPNLDYIIDATGVRLMGVVPEDEEIPRSSARGHIAGCKGYASLAFDRLAARLEGEKILIPKKIGEN